jgi:hypothetical protein
MKYKVSIKKKVESGLDSLPEKSSNEVLGSC